MNKEEDIIDPELECSICNDLLFRPVSINCGHTFCKECLGVTIRTKPQCPLCRTPCFLQENNLKENVTLRTIIENKYPSHIKRRSEVRPQKQEEEKLVQDDNQAQEEQEQNFNPMIVLPLQGRTRTLFPGSDNQTLVVRLNFDPNILKNVCNDKRILAVPDSKIQDKSQYMTCILEMVNLEPHLTSKDLYKVQVKVHERVMLKQYGHIELDKKILESWGYTNIDKVLSLQVGSGCFIKDKNSQESFEQIQSSVAQVEEFFNGKIDNWSRTSPESANFVMQRMLPVLQTGNDRSMEYFVNFSFASARLLQSSEEEKKKNV